MSLKQSFLYLGLVYTALSLFSCALYRPSPIHNPLLKEAGDIQIGGSIGSGFSAETAYSPIDHFYLNGKYYTASKVRNNTNDSILPQIEEEYPNYHYEFGIGFYDTLFSNLRVQGALGYGMGESGGEIKNDALLPLLFPPLFLFINDGIYGASFENYFGQLSFHQRIGNGLNLGIAYRLNYLEFGQFNFFSTDGNTANFDLDSRAHYVDQLAIELNKEERDVGGYLQIQLAAARPYSEIVTVRTFGLHFGIYLKLNELFNIPRRQKPRRVDDNHSYRRFGN